MTNSEFSTIPDQERVDKPWGYEIIYTVPSLPYTGKIMHIKAGSRLSLHYHEQKRETLCLLSGNAVIWLEDSQGQIQKIPMELEKGYHISLGQKHRIETTADSVVIEVSLPETGTTVRVEDDFARSNETEAIRKTPHRGWEAHHG